MSLEKTILNNHRFLINWSHLFKTPLLTIILRLFSFLENSKKLEKHFTQTYEKLLFSDFFPSKLSKNEYKVLFIICITFL
jgi:hypothetical protein